MATRGGGGRRGAYQQPSGGRGGGYQNPSARGGGNQQPSGRGGGGRGQQPARGGRFGGGGDASGRGSHMYNAPPPPHQPSTSVFSHSQTVSPAPLVPSLSETTRQFDNLNVQSGASAAPASSSSAPPAVESIEITATEQTDLPPVSSKAVKFVRRPNFGKAGIPCLIRANHFRVEIADRDIHQYDVSITPEVLSKKVCREIMNALTKEYKAHLGMQEIAYDGRKSVYVSQSLPFTSQDFTVQLGDSGSKRERIFKVSIKFAAKADIHHLKEFLASRQFDAPQETIQALDVVLRERPSNIYVAAGRSFFHPTLGDKGRLGEGLDYWMGFYQSLRPTQMGLSLNIDISARPFYEPILVTDFIISCMNLRGTSRSLSDQDRLKVKKVLKGIRVEVTHIKSVRRYKISGLSNQPLGKLSFPIDDSGNHKSVVDYFREKYNITLQYDYLPALQAGTDAKPTYLPMEVCRIVEGQRYGKKLNERQVSALLKATCRRPKIREGDIKQMVSNNDYNNDKLVSKYFGLQVAHEPASINARLLPPPWLKYHQSGRDSRIKPKTGTWNMMNAKMINGGHVDSWTCVNFSRARREVEAFCHGLVDMCVSRGMEFNNMPVLPIETCLPARAEEILFKIHKLCSQRPLQLLIVILPEANGLCSLYGTIKRVCETQLGIVSQCCRPKNILRVTNQYLENLAMKINVKVGGRNLLLEPPPSLKKHYLTDMPTIVFGADVTHPQPGDDASSSIAAVVASMDWPEVTKYRGLVSAQSHRQEIIQDLYTCDVTEKGIVHGGMIRDHLRAYYILTKQKPNRIIFYRDGVSEGQFAQVLLHEVDAIRKACVSLQENYLPRITFVVVQKRHHTRLFPGVHDDRNTTDKSGNILAGTVVDVKICHPTEFDFYLCSHAGIQGTSRPTHYHVLLDENAFSADELQGLTNNLCYTYARCTKAVSIVPPAYYAHLAAFRARYYVEGRMSDVDSSTDGRGHEERHVEIRALPKIKDNVKEVMFYC